MNKPIPPPRFKQIRPPNANYTYFEDRQHHQFVPGATSFELVNAAWLADFAMLAYGKAEFIQQELDESGLTADGFAMQFFSQQTTQAFIASNNEIVVASFRGTEIDNFWGAFEDWVRNLELEPAPDGSDGEVHSGFLKDINAAWPEIEDQLRRLLNGTSRTLWITGHSLGAGLSTLAAVRARRAGFDVRGVYNYGAPRVGDAAYAQHYTDSGLAGKTFRFVHDVDIVPAKLPPGDLYQHLGQEKFIDAQGHLHDGPPAGHAVSHLQAAFDEIKEIESQGLTLLEDAVTFEIPARFADHAPIYYASYIWNSLPS